MRKSNVRDKLQLSLLRQQYQLDHLQKVKCFIQNQILKRNTDVDVDSEKALKFERIEKDDNVPLYDWDTYGMREIIRRLLPHGDIVLDD